MRRKNPCATSRLFIRELRAGDDDAVHEIRGQLVLDGDVDTVVLRVKENAEIERTLLVKRLEVGRSNADPYGSGGSSSGGYPSNGSPPSCGASIDEDGTIRTSGWVVINDSAKGLVLRSPEGKHFSFTVDEDGQLVSPGTFLGYVAP